MGGHEFDHGFHDGAVSAARWALVLVVSLVMWAGIALAVMAVA